MPAEPEQPAVWCVRNDTNKTADEHLQRAYCHGRSRRVVEQGEHRDFCD